MPEDIKYFILVATLLVLPKVLMRLRIPTALTALSLGFFFSVYLGWFQDDQLILLFSRLGITSLFLFAGMEVELSELKSDSNIILKHLSMSLVVLALVSYGVHYFFSLNIQESLILSLGLITPSAGFILNSLKNYKLKDSQLKWVKVKAISKELLAVVILFVALLSNDLQQLFVSTLIVVFMIVVLPYVFRFFLDKIAPYAPDSEVTFLILLALLCGVLTKKIGAYYLVGAFIVGIIAGQFKHFIRQDKTDKMLYSISFFFSFFVPFYFFKAGSSFSTEMFSLKGLGVGLVFFVLINLIRALAIMASVKFFLLDSWKDRKLITMPLLPTLIFGLVIAELLMSRFQVPNDIVSGLIISTLLTSTIPWFFLRQLPPENYDTDYIRQ